MTEAPKLAQIHPCGETAEQLDSFRVHPQYEELEQEASGLTRQIHELSNDNVSDRELLEFYDRALTEENPAELLAGNAREPFAHAASG